jgi:hypothetical protein
MSPADTTFAQPRIFLNDDGRIVLEFPGCDEGTFQALMTVSQTINIASMLLTVARQAAEQLEQTLIRPALSTATITAILSNKE